MPNAGEKTPIELDARHAVASWGAGSFVREFFHELLPACFERSLCIDELSDAAIEWIFTGPRGGITLRIARGDLRVYRRFYDSPALAELTGGDPPRHPQWVSPPAIVSCEPTWPRRVAIGLDHKLGLSVRIDDHEVHRAICPLDLSRHQLKLSNSDGRFRGAMQRPQARFVHVRVDPRGRHQAMIGFGGTTIPTAYALLSEAGKSQWWKLIREYNLLIQREYPIGTRLSGAMDNWEALADASPHYYGDNFPNGEIVSFDYNRALRELGGKVWFEFWDLPPWAKEDVEQYARAVVGYCKASRARAGVPPDVVGVQNEVSQPTEKAHAMTLALRRALDAAGFAAVKIHMSDDGHLAGAIRRARLWKENASAWAAIDFAASHVYDYQDYVTDPDAYDELLRTFARETAGKPFLCTEVCLNDARWQHDSFRVALSVAQLYHKALVHANASALCYCWTLLNVVQPSYGATRSLCVPDEAHGFVPRASSHQLRVMGAFSRRVREGMARVVAGSDDSDLLVAAFESRERGATVVLINRSMSPADVRVEWAGVQFAEVEIVDPYHPNSVRRFDDGSPLRVDAGTIATLTNVPLNCDSE